MSSRENIKKDDEEIDSDFSFVSTDSPDVWDSDEWTPAKSDIETISDSTISDENVESIISDTYLFEDLTECYDNVEKETVTECNNTNDIIEDDNLSETVSKYQQRIDYNEYKVTDKSKKGKEIQRSLEKIREKWMAKYRIDLVTNILKDLIKEIPETSNRNNSKKSWTILEDMVEKVREKSLRNNAEILTESNMDVIDKKKYEDLMIENLEIGNNNVLVRKLLWKRNESIIEEKDMTIEKTSKILDLRSTNCVDRSSQESVIVSNSKDFVQESPEYLINPLMTNPKMLNLLKTYRPPQKLKPMSQNLNNFSPDTLTNQNESTINEKDFEIEILEYEDYFDRSNPESNPKTIVEKHEINLELPSSHELKNSSQERLPNENSKNKNEKGFETEILEYQDYFGRTDSEILSESNLKNVVGKNEKNSEEASPSNLEVLSKSHSMGNFNPQTVIDWIDRDLNQKNHTPKRF